MDRVALRKKFKDAATGLAIITPIFVAGSALMSRSSNASFQESAVTLFGGVASVVLLSSIFNKYYRPTLKKAAISAAMEHESTAYLRELADRHQERESTRSNQVH